MKTVKEKLHPIAIWQIYARWDKMKGAKLTNFLSRLYYNSGLPPDDIEKYNKVVLDIFKLFVEQKW